MGERLDHRGVQHLHTREIVPRVEQRPKLSNRCQ